MARLEENLRGVRERIAAAARAAGRDPASVALLAVSKTWPADDVRALAALGQRDFGENRAQELIAKAAELRRRSPCAGTSSASSSGTRPPRSRASARSSTPSTARSLADVLDRAGRGAAEAVEVLLQVDLGGSGGRGRRPAAGPPPRRSRRWPTPWRRRAGLRLRGLMAVAPRGEDPAPAFERLAALAARVRADHPEAVELSAGMSGDLEAAIAAGATIVRVGTALFGDRPLVSG